MTEGARVMLFSNDQDADLDFARDLLALACSDAGGGWPVFILPPGQSGIDDYGNDDSHQLYLHCRDLDPGSESLRRALWARVDGAAPVPARAIGSSASGSRSSTRS